MMTKGCKWARSQLAEAMRLPQDTPDADLYNRLLELFASVDGLSHLELNPELFGNSPDDLTEEEVEDLLEMKDAIMMETASTTVKQMTPFSRKDHPAPTSAADNKRSAPASTQEKDPAAKRSRRNSSDADKKHTRAHETPAEKTERRRERKEKSDAKAAAKAEKKKKLKAEGAEELRLRTAAASAKAKAKPVVPTAATVAAKPPSGPTACDAYMSGLFSDPAPKPSKMIDEEEEEEDQLLSELYAGNAEEEKETWLKNQSESSHQSAANEALRAEEAERSRRLQQIMDNEKREDQLKEEEKKRIASEKAAVLFQTIKAQEEIKAQAARDQEIEAEKAKKEIHLQEIKAQEGQLRAQKEEQARLAQQLTESDMLIGQAQARAMVENRALMTPQELAVRLEEENKVTTYEEGWAEDDERRVLSAEEHRIASVQADDDRLDELHEEDWQHQISHDRTSESHLNWRDSGCPSSSIPEHVNLDILYEAIAAQTSTTRAALTNLRMHRLTQETVRSNIWSYVLKIIHERTLASGRRMEKLEEFMEDWELTRAGESGHSPDYGEKLIRRVDNLVVTRATHRRLTAATEKLINDVGALGTDTVEWLTTLLDDYKTLA
jgi:hypothetical protein